MTTVSRAARVTASAPSRTAILKGKVRLQLVGGASKSRRRSLIMSSHGKTIWLQRRGGNPFEIDAKERALIGKTVELKGSFVSDHLFRFTAAKTIDPKK